MKLYTEAGLLAEIMDDRMDAYADRRQPVQPTPTHPDHEAYKARRITEDRRVKADFVASQQAAYRRWT